MIAPAKNFQLRLEINSMMGSQMAKAKRKDDEKV